MTNAESEAQESLSKFFDSDKHRAFVAPPNVVWNDETQTVLPELQPVRHYRQRLLKRDYILINRALAVYHRWWLRQPYDRNCELPDLRPGWSDPRKSAVWRSNAGTTVILRDDLGQVVASYDLHNGYLDRIHRNLIPRPRQWHGQESPR
jgi:hypothetical protein